MSENVVDEGAVKDALSTLAQQKLLEFFNRSLIFEANLAVVQQEKVQLLNTIKELNEEISELENKSSQTNDERNKKIGDLDANNSKLLVENEALTTRLNDLVGKIDTGYKPRIKELEDKLKKME